MVNRGKKAVEDAKQEVENFVQKGKENLDKIEQATN